MTKIVLAAVGAALVFAVATPTLACGGGGYSYRAPHHAKAADVSKTAKPATPAASPDAIETTGPALPSAGLPSGNPRI